MVELVGCDAPFDLAIRPRATLQSSPPQLNQVYPCAPYIGTCRTSSSLASPLNMWTPHGRQGSKLRTARMMSTPLNLFGPFSSKIGVFCTASSYGPGVP